VDQYTHTSPVCNLWAGTGNDQNGQPDDCPVGTEAACRVEGNKAGTAVGPPVDGVDCSAFGRVPGVAAWTQSQTQTKNTNFTVSAVLVHSGKCLSGVSFTYL
jgi:hypothetical protein